jgi:transglutaminase-like putative cysteine protease
MALQAEQHALEDLPAEVPIYLLGSRYCETDRLSNRAWSLLKQIPRGWPLVNAISDYVHNRITFGYAHASATKTAWDADTERRGVCRDYAHLAVTLCRCMNIPARYCTGYLGDIGVRSTML